MKSYAFQQGTNEMINHTQMFLCELVIILPDLWHILRINILLATGKHGYWHNATVKQNYIVLYLLTAACTWWIIDDFSFPLEARRSGPGAWWRHRMETFSVLLAICAGNSPVNEEFPAQRPVTQSFDVFFDLRLINGWVNNRGAGDLRRCRAHYDVTAMGLVWNLFTAIFVMCHAHFIAIPSDWRYIAV